VSGVKCPKHQKVEMTPCLPKISYWCWQCEKEYYKYKGELKTRFEIIKLQKRGA
jgi:hypothetical protein